MNWTEPTMWQPRGIASLSPEALQAVQGAGNVLVLAGPGAGKTELLAQRASFLLETGLCSPPHRILAISFKRDAAYNLRERVQRRCGPALAARFDSFTFDGWAKGLLDRFRLALPPAYRPCANYDISFALLDEQPLRNRLLGGCDAAGVARNRLQGAGKPQLLAFYHEYVLGHCLVLSEGPRGNPGLRALGEYFWQSTLHTGDKSKLEFSMISALGEYLLRANPLLLKALQHTYQFVFLDEFQDTTALQYNLLRTAFFGSAAKLTAVGDTKQRIMLWAGADAGVFDHFTRDFAAERVRLAVNYRSAPRLVAIQQHLIRALDRESPLVQPAATWQPHEGECRIWSYPDSRAEARHLAWQFARWMAVDGIQPSDVCVIVRQKTGIYTAALQRALGEWGIRCQVQDALQDLRTEPVVKLAVDAFRWCAEPQAPHSWRALLTRVQRVRGVEDGHVSGVRSRQVSAELTGFLEQLRERLCTAGTLAEIELLIRELLVFVGESAFCLAHEQYRHSAFLFKTIRDCARQLAAVRAQHEHWSGALDEFMGVDAVPMMTIHKSKGLEYHTVVFIGLEDVPFFGIGAGTDEEECNFFVAFSRAKKRVIFTHSAVRYNEHGNGMPQTRAAVDSLFQLLRTAGVAEEAPEGIAVPHPLQEGIIL